MDSGQYNSKVTGGTTYFRTYQLKADGVVDSLDGYEATWTLALSANWPALYSTSSDDAVPLISIANDVVTLELTPEVTATFHDLVQGSRGYYTLTLTNGTQTYQWLEGKLHIEAGILEPEAVP